MVSRSLRKRIEETPQPMPRQPMPRNELMRVAVEVLSDVIDNRTPRPEAVAILRANAVEANDSLDALASAIIQRELEEFAG
jgi:hypothetical protein